MPISTQLKEVISTFGDLINQFTKSKVGIDFKETIERNKNQFYGNLIFDKFKQKKDLFEKLYKSIAEYTAEKQLIILIDELDRTRPDYAVNFLETLKHFFDIKGLIFILAVNKEQLKHSVECIYGKIDLDEYYRKFAQRDIDLPYSENGINKFMIKKVDEFFQKIENKEKKIGIKKEYLQQEDFTLKAYMKELFIKFKLSLRQINQFFQIYLSLLIHEKSTQSFGYQIASIIYLAIDIHNSEIAKKILNNEFNYSEILNLLESKTVDLSDRMALYLLFLFSNNQGEISSNFKIYKSKFGQNNIDLNSRKYDLFKSHSDIETFFVMQDVGKKISQSKNFFS